MKTFFIILVVAMDGSTGTVGTCSVRSAMTRCECAELPFEEVARRVLEDGASLEEVQERTGCGRLCTACLPDLSAHLARRR
jgi:NAD(P)H-nitrite reductase large subunit